MFLNSLFQAVLAPKLGKRVHGDGMGEVLYEMEVKTSHVENISYLPCPC